MSSKSKSPTAPSLPPQPPAPELMDIIDEISGVQTITVTGPDGKKRRHTQRLPLTPQEKQILSQAEGLISQAVTNIQTLYSYDPSTVVNYQPFIQTFSNINAERMNDLAQIGNFKDIAEKVEQFRRINRDIAMTRFDENQRMAEESLSRRGLSRSTEANELRAAMAKERGLLEQELDVNAQNYGEDLTGRQLDREARVFNFRESGRQARLQEAEAGYELERQKADDLMAARQRYIEENKGVMDVANSLKGDTQKANVGLAQSQNAISLFNAQANNQNQRYSSELSRIKSQYKMDMDAASRAKPSFGSRLRDIGMAAAGAYTGGAISGAMGGITPQAAGYSFGSRLWR